MPSSGSGCLHRVSGSGRWCRPRDGSEQRKWLLAPHQRKWPLMQVKKDPQQKWLLAPHQWKLLLMHILPKSQDPEADGWPDDKFSLAPTDPEAPPMSVGHWAPNKMSRLRRRDLHRLVQRKLRAWMRRLRRLRALTWPESPSHKVIGPDEGQADLKRLFFFNMVKEDIICCDAGM